MCVGLFEKGWECPKCGAVMSPIKSACINCRGGREMITNTITKTITIQDFIEKKDGADNER